jgi:CRISPR-associated protein Cas5h
MKIISFNLRGKTAHFRKFYSNSSAFSYFIPPRTTIMGIIAGLLGMERDSYYDTFSLDDCSIAVTSIEPIKKTMQKLNYLMVKSKSDLNGSQEHHSQTSIELVIPQNIRTGYIDYKVWFYHKDDEVMDRLEHIVNEKLPCYGSFGSCMAMGSAFNIGWIDSGRIYDGVEVKELSEATIASAVPIDKLKEIRLDEHNNRYKLIKEEVPLEFDSQRCITERGLKDIIVNIDGGTITAVVDTFVQLDNGEVILWME